ncbi:DnaA ATPase domain-containing protein [Spiroplasma culicicola]|uniref:Primosomal protein DnaI n=1 Tax=Spiroplasma culicicola AES-1 TaxID=1276246 RepID=W6A7X2_9MOLU|nr:DnaA/Hda family protein [Spiroplasma culicicola]AHI53213.1 primosomal protein DnaI [Spiroplasma culicicola AES-1]
MQKTLNEIKNNQIIKPFIQKYNISDEILEKNNLLLTRVIEQIIICKENEPMSECHQIIKGVQQKLSFVNNEFYIKSENCNHWKFEHQDYKIQKNIVFAQYDVKEYTNTIDDYKKENPKLSVGFPEFLNHVKKMQLDPSKWKGIYLYGAPGIGKTYLMKTVANTFAKNDKKVVVVTVNKLIQTVKETFNKTFENDYNKFLDLCTNIDVLILDDIGAEIVSDWSRDELLFGVLNTRLENKKITFFTSNFSIAELEEYYLNKKLTKQAERNFDKNKTIRFTERIKGLAIALKLEGDNKRY